MADNVIGIKFGVAGEGSISGESGKLIKSQLEQIAKAVNLQVKVNINKTHFKTQLTELKKEIDSTLGDLRINVGATGNKGGGSGGASGGGQKSDYSSLMGTLNKINGLQKQIDAANKKGASETVKVLTAQMEELERAYKDKLAVARENKQVTDEEVAAMEKHKAYLESLTTARRKDAEAAQVQAAADKANKQTSTKKNAWDGLFANAQRLLQREDYLIQNNKEAAASAERLATAMKAGFDNSSPEAAAASVERLRAALKQTDAELAEIGTRADTFGFKIKKAFKTKVVQNLAYALLALVGNAFRQVYRNVVELDKAVTDLQIATGKTREETGALVKEYANLAKQLGATVTQVTSAADTWLRQGYNVAETNTLIANTLMLSKLGQLDSAEAAKALTSAMKGYKVSVEECIRVVDKFTAVDMEAAVSAGDIATAMAETATSADIAGVSMDKLIGYIATVSEVTQDGAESVGTFYKTLFARMGNVKAGKFVDDENSEALNDVEKVLAKVGISLRYTNGTFRDFEVVLDEVAKKWNTYDNVQQHAIATAFAGTRQQEKFIVLMENYGSALEYAATAANSAGTAQEKYQEAYLDSIDAKLNELTATWEEFSTLILDSDLVKFGVEFLTNIVELLNALADAGDGILITIPLLTVGLSTIYALLIKIKGTTVFITMWTHLKSVLMVFPSIILGLKSIVLNIKAEAAAHTLSRNALLAKTAATKAATAAQQAMNATNPVGWIILAATAIVGLVKGIASYVSSCRDAKEESEKYKETAQELKESADKAKETTETLVDLLAEYKQLARGIDNASSFDAETRQRVLEIQEKITELVGEEAANYALLNGEIETNLKNNYKLLQGKVGGDYQKALDAYYAAADSSSHAYETSYVDVGGFNFWGLFGLTEPETWYQMTIQAGKNAEKYADEVYDIIAGMDERITIAADATIGDKFYGINFNVDSADEMVEVLDELLGKMKAAGMRDGNIYATFNSMREKYAAYLAEESQRFSEAISSATMMYGVLNFEEGLSVETLDGYKAYRDKIISLVENDEELKKLGIDKTTIENSVDNWLSMYFGEWYTKLAEETRKAIIYEMEFLDILQEVEEEFDALSSALKDIEKEGVLSAKSLEKLFDEYEGLQKYFKLTSQGYVLGDAYQDWAIGQVLEDYVQNMLQPYVDALDRCTEGTDEYAIAQDNLNKAIAVGATLLRSQAIEEATEAYEKQQDILEEQLKQYKSLIDTRKDLLATYKEEVKYQEELAKKEKNIANIQTRLALSKMDTSAAGKARTRELEKELQDAQGELDDFTLEHAIDKITKEIDSAYDEYEKFIDTEVDRLEEAIKNIAKNIKVNITLPTANASGSSTEKTSIDEVPEHHTGGFVGGVELQSHEEFAKLMKGEFVVTPSQMSRFMGETLPTMVGGGTGGEVNYNAPLITIKCDSITKEAVPEVEKIVNEAVNKIKTEIDSAFSRTGFKKKI